MSTSQTPTVDQLKRALEIAEQIQSLETELAGLLSMGPATVSGAYTVRGSKAVAGNAELNASGRPGKLNLPERAAKRVVSLEARARMAEAARKRWAAVRDAQ